MFSSAIGRRLRRRMPLAKDVVGVEDAFIDLLQHISGTKEEKQAYFRSRSIQVPRTNYVSMWEALAGSLHRSGAASAVFELLRTRIPGRVSGLLRTAKQGRPVALYAPAIVDDLFFQNGKLRKLGELFVEDLESRGVSMGRAVSSKSGAALKVVLNAKPYEIALSFAGEDRKLVGEVAGLLKSYGVAVFYDKFEEVQLMGEGPHGAFGRNLQESG
jgi:hypothetical protein